MTYRTKPYLSTSAQSLIFFVAEVTFADGSNWEVDIKDIAPEAGRERSFVKITERTYEKRAQALHRRRESSPSGGDIY